MATLRQVLVDDTNPFIQYSPEGWFVADPNKLKHGNFGTIYNAMSHATTSSNSTLSYSFNGTSILVQGTIDMSTDTNNVTNPNWDCFVDGIKIPSKTFQFPENNWPLCQQDNFTSGSHILTIQVNSQGQVFYFDSLVYTPTLDAMYPSAVLIYVDGDLALNYSLGWMEAAGEQVTQIRNAHVTLNFHGTSASLIGHISNQFPPNTTSTSYTIDGGTPITFPLPGLASAKSATQYNSVFFMTPTLSDGFHSLTVTHGSDIDQTPLTVKYFYVTNKTSLSFPVSSTATTLPTSLSGSIPSRSRTGLIAGGVFSGLVLLALLAVLCFWCQKRKTRDLEEAATNPYPMAMADSSPPRVLLSGGSSKTSRTSELSSLSRVYKQMPVNSLNAVWGILNVLGHPSLGKGIY